MTGDSGNDGNISDLPWVSLFDPAMNVRALGEIQARGFRAASELVDRFVRTPRTDPEPDIGSPRSESRDGDESVGAVPTTPDAQKIGQAWQRVMGEMVGSFRGVAQPYESKGAAFDLVRDDAIGSVTIEVAEMGIATGEVWLHNGGATDLGDVRLRASPLMAHDGALVCGDQITFDPAVVSMPPRTSRGIVISILIDSSIAPGRYRGTLLASGHEDVWLPIVLTVTAPAS